MIDLMVAAPSGNVLQTAGSAACSLAVALFAVLLIYFDRYISARQAAETLLQYIHEVASSATSEASKIHAHAVERRVEAAAKSHGRFHVLYATRILAGWRDAHALERRLVSDLTLGQVKARLSSGGADLRALSRPDAETLAVDIDVFFGKVAKNHDPVHSYLADDPAALLQEVLRVIHDGRDSAYDAQSATEAKAFGLGLLGLILIVVASVALHRETFLVMGAVGGFLSRLTRLIRSRPLPSDYGASWTMFMLAPVVGALAGWSGVALANLLTQIHVLDSSTFAGLWDKPTDITALGLALLLGVSERLFDRFVSLGEGGIGKNPRVKGGKGTELTADESP